MTILLVLLTALAMEPFSAGVHRYIGHGVAWPLHKSHHEGPVTGPEANDVIPAVSAALTIAMFALGTARPGLGVLVPIAAGATIYGAAYFLVHDCYIHRRVPLLPRCVGWLEPFKAAHLVHHRTGTGHWGIFSAIIGARPAVAAPRR
jgi:beta-carotene 3-hydroxylase